jgi:hypothetical protein
VQSPPFLYRILFTVKLLVHLVLLGIGYYTSLIVLPKALIAPVTCVIHGSFGTWGLIIPYICVILRVSNLVSYFFKNSHFISFMLGLGFRASFMFFRSYLSLGVRLSIICSMLFTSFLTNKHNNKFIMGLGGVLSAALALVATPLRQSRPLASDRRGSALLLSFRY